MSRRTTAWVTAGLLGLLGSSNAMALESGFYLGVVGAQAKIDLAKSDFDAYERDPLATSFSSSLEDSDTAFGVVLGGQFGRWFAVEAQLLNLGEYTYKSTQSIANFFASSPRNLDIRSDTKVEAAAVTLSGILTIPIGEQFAVGLRLGFAANATESTFKYGERRGSAPYNFDIYDDDGEASDVGATYGISFEWAPTAHVGVRLDYQVITHVGGEDDDYDYDEDDFFDDDDYYDDVAEQDGYDADLVSLNLLYRF